MVAIDRHPQHMDEEVHRFGEALRPRSRRLLPPEM